MNILRSTETSSFSPMESKKRSKITVIGAGNVGAASAMRILEAGLGDIVLLDIAGGIAKGKAEDLMDAASLIGHGCKITGTSDYSQTKDSDIVVVCAGLARKPGMTREELLNKNACIVKDITRNFMKFNHRPVVIVVTNPLDVISYVVYKESGLSGKRVVGMAGCLDSSRMNLISSRFLEAPLDSFDAVVMGTHGETMVCLTGSSKAGKEPLARRAPKDAIDRIVEKTKSRGAEIVSYLGTGSAFFAPSAGVFRMVKAILEDSRETMPCSCLLNGEYGVSGIFLGVPVVLGKEGIMNIVQMSLSDDEKRLLNAASNSISSQIAQLNI
ncbi:MAG: malate dehydrogenase [Candidatus Omnitrophica bacterium]|nr:malate dehydrogenase [Candidatus Omnitrophota bacterium]